MAKDTQRMVVVPEATKRALAEQSAERCERARYDAGQELLLAIEVAFDRCSRKVLKDMTIDLARVVIKAATLEDLRARMIDLVEVIGL